MINIEGTARILKRFVNTTIIISLFLLVTNFILLGIVVFKGINTGQSPGTVVQKVAENLHSESGTYYLGSGMEDTLKQNKAWAMLIDNTGYVAWEYMLPEEVPKKYSLSDVAKFTRNYLMDYPVFVWEHSEGLVVVGYPRESLAKYVHVFPTEWAYSLPMKLVFLFAANIVLALLLSLIIGSGLIRSIRPLTRGIQDLAEDREVYIEPKGVLSGIAHSVNRASALLQ